MARGETEVLEHFGIGRDQVIAHTGESSVYVLDDERVLRIPKGEVDYYVKKDELCSEIASSGLPFEVPRLLDHGHVAGTAYTIEARIPGRSLDVVLGETHGDDRRTALTSFAAAAIALGSVRIDRPWYGELLYNDDLRRRTWGAYLVARAEEQFDRAAVRLRDDIADLDGVFDTIRSELHAVESAPALAHGDYFPGNVMMSDDLVVTGVIDFGFSTVVGDPRLDLAGASAFLEVEREWAEPGDAGFVRAYLVERVPELVDVDSLYRSYYAVYFAFVHEFGIDALYGWCVRVLRERHR